MQLKCDESHRRLLSSFFNHDGYIRHLLNRIASNWQLPLKWKDEVPMCRWDMKTNHLVELKITSREKMNCSLNRNIWSVNKNYPIIRTWLSNGFQLLDEFLNYKSEDFFWEGEALSTKTLNFVHRTPWRTICYVGRTSNSRYPRNKFQTLFEVQKQVDQRPWGMI